MKVVEDLGTKVYGNQGRKKRFFLVECPLCQKHFEVFADNVKSGKTTQCLSCSAKKSKRTHGKSSTRLYTIWTNMIQRCENPKNSRYGIYGGKGISVNKDWRHSFQCFEDWALKNGYDAHLTIDRIDSDKGYYQENCRWTDYTVQAQNQGLRKDTSTGFTGVYFRHDRDCYVAKITVNKKVIHIGSFISKTDAAKARDEYILTNKLKHKTAF